MKRVITLFSLIASVHLSAQNFNITFRSNLPYPGQTLANIWGYVDSLGNEYALAGASQGLSIVNVTDPDLPVEVVQIPWPVQNSGSLWKEVKTWGKYAYVVSEAGRGLQIIDLSKLPGTVIPYKQWEPIVGTTQLNNIHSLHIDNGFAYLYGGATQGVVIADLSDPWNPLLAGYWNQNYIHDGYVRNDTIYSAQIYSGIVGVIDVTDKSNPIQVHTQSTPGNFTHNTWLSDNSKTIFTTDEVPDSYLTAYDISDINNFIEMDRIQANPGSGSTVHNTHIKNDWAINSYYKDGVNIVDAHRPSNLIQVGLYDTYSAGLGTGFEGAWGVYPYLPSGTLVVSNIDEGLFVLTPNYVRACYLEGVITDSLTGQPLNDVKVELINSRHQENSKLTGEYATGSAVSGSFTVLFTKAGYQTKTINGINLSSGNVTILNVKLLPVKEEHFSVYPNPYKTSLTVSYKTDSLQDPPIFIVTDILGKEISFKILGNYDGVFNYNEDLASGIYFIRLKTQDGFSKPFKVIKAD